MSSRAGTRASYRPRTDTIHLPPLAQFDHAAHYYATSAHEHIHWTGHPDRLARDHTGRFGSDAYTAEETRRRARGRHVVRSVRHQRRDPPCTRPHLIWRCGRGASHPGRESAADVVQETMARLLLASAKTIGAACCMTDFVNEASYVY